MLLLSLCAFSILGMKACVRVCAACMTLLQWDVHLQVSSCAVHCHVLHQALRRIPHPKILPLMHLLQINPRYVLRCCCLSINTAYLLRGKW